MAIKPEIHFAEIDKFYLDSKNPRLGRRNVESNLTQQQTLKLMADWSLEELAVSFLESGFWPQEALMVVEERKHKIVVEGNRRLAALKLLWQAEKGDPIDDRWKAIAKSGTKAAFNLLRKAPYVQADSRKDVVAYLGFRHVSGIKEWKPAEKAQYISHLIEDEGLNYEQVRRKIGSKTPTVRTNYISYRLLLQMEDEGESIEVENVEERFSVLYLSLRSSGTQTYLDIDIKADPKSARNPVPKAQLKNLAKFARWLFGDKKHKPLIPDSRDVDDFGTVLESSKAIAYLERTEHPSFETAFRIAGGGETETANHLDRAADEIEEALSTVHHHKKSARILEAVERLGRDMDQLKGLFPEAVERISEARR